MGPNKEFENLQQKQVRGAKYLVPLLWTKKIEVPKKVKKIMPQAPNG